MTQLIRKSKLLLSSSRVLSLQSMFKSTHFGFKEVTEEEKVEKG